VLESYVKCYRPRLCKEPKECQRSGKDRTLFPSIGHPALEVLYGLVCCPVKQLCVQRYSAYDYTCLLFVGTFSCQVENTALSKLLLSA
jgi:hypothetical protein